MCVEWKKLLVGSFPHPSLLSLLAPSLSVGVWAALVAANASSSNDVRNVSPTVLHAELVKEGQVLKTPAHVSPVVPYPKRHVFSCSAAFGRCLAVLSSSSQKVYNTSSCDGQCSAMASAEWLALKGAKGGFAIENASVIALSSQSWLKKSQEHSSVLPDAMKRLLAKGASIPIVDTSPPVLSDGYWLVTCEEVKR